jgi:menaquinone-9 beta-reductase
MEQAMTTGSFGSTGRLADPAWDVVVIGAGPAGAVAATLAARHGLRTLLVDAKRFPRRKACGGCLSRSAVTALRQFGLDDVVCEIGAAPIDRIRFTAQSSTSEIDLPAGYAIDRARFDAVMVDRATRVGAEFQPGCTAKVLGAQGGWQQVHLAVGERSEVATTHVAVVADGLLRSSLHSESCAPSNSARHARIGVATVIEGNESDIATGIIEMSIARQGYAGAVRLDDERVLIAAALDRDALKSRSIGEAVAAILLEGGRSATSAITKCEWMSSATLTRRPRQIAGERWFAIGDAAGYVEPFTGDGMATAIESAIAVAPWLAEAQAGWHPEFINAWSDAHGRIVRRRQWLCQGLAWTLRRPWAVRGLLALSRSAPVLTSRSFARLQQPRDFSSKPHGQAAIA